MNNYQINTWKAILNKDEQLVHKILNNIRKSVDYNIINNKDVSLRNGIIGYSLFLMWHDQLLNRSNNIHLIFERLNKRISEAKLDSTYMNGLSGISWFYFYVANKFSIKYEKDFIKSLIELDEYIKPNIELVASKRNIDLFKGLNGKSVYLIEKSIFLNEYQDLRQLFRFYKKISINDEQGVRWLSSKALYDIIKDKEVAYPELIIGEIINLGLAHGMLGVIIILSKLFELGIMRSEIQNVLLKSIKWILKLRKKNHDREFPSVVNLEKHSNPKIGWCYGDLSIGYTIAFTGQCLNSQDLMNIGIEIGKNSSRYDKINAEINSPHFCHGAAGIAHIYNRFYHLTKEIEFLNRAQYWYNILFEMYNSNNSIGGFFSFDESSYGLQFGISGIGLSLISGLSNNEPTWDNCFLLS